MLVLGKPTCRHPAVDTGERRGPFSEVGKDSPGRCPFPAEQRGGHAAPYSSALRMRCPQDVVIPHLIRVEAGTPGQPNGGLGGPRAGGTALQLVETVQAAAA